MTLRSGNGEVRCVRPPPRPCPDKRLKPRGGRSDQEDRSNRERANKKRKMKMDGNDIVYKAQEVIRLKGYSARTEQVYLDWIKKFLLFHRDRDPGGLGSRDIQSFLTHLARDEGAAASTQNQALSALLFLFKGVLERRVDPPRTYARIKKPRCMPVVLTREEVQAILDRMRGPKRIMAALLYGSGLRLMECLRLRVGDILLDERVIVVRDERSRKGRETILPESLVPALKAQMERVRKACARELGPGETIPDWESQYVFPSPRRSLTAGGKQRTRCHVAESALQKAVKKAVIAAGVDSRASCHSLRHSFAVHLLEAGYDIGTVQKLLGHQDMKTTSSYAGLARKRRIDVKSPLDYAPWTLEF